jgi:hypothetical protein
MNGGVNKRGSEGVREGAGGRVETFIEGSGGSRGASCFRVCTKQRFARILTYALLCQVILLVALRLGISTLARAWVGRPLRMSDAGVQPLFRHVGVNSPTSIYTQAHSCQGQRRARVSCLNT